MEGGQEGRLGALLVDGTPASDRRAISGLVDDRRLKGRMRPLGWVHLLHVIHEIDANTALGTGVEGGENARAAVGGHFLHHLEPGVPQKAHGEVAAFIHPPLFSSDAGVTDPRL